jgi:hypothetical protein
MSVLIIDGVCNFARIRKIFTRGYRRNVSIELLGLFQLSTKELPALFVGNIIGISLVTLRVRYVFIIDRYSVAQISVRAVLATIRGWLQ